MMDSFKRKFVEEALDLLNELETVLLRMESRTEDKELFERIFRIMHTLKGNSAMFGFTLIDQYTHQLETIYDLIRSGKMKVSQELMDLTLASVDHIRNLLDYDRSMKPDVQEKHQSLLQKIGIIIEGKNQPVVRKPSEIPIDKDATGSYYVHFQPYPEILSNGTNPLFLVEDFKALGEYLAIPAMALPPLEGLEPEKCYTSWEIIIATKEDIKKIYEIFIFAEDSCTLDVQKLSDNSLLLDASLCKRIIDASNGRVSLGFQGIKEIISSGDKPAETREEESSRNVERAEQANQPSNISDVTSKMKNISSIRVSSDKLDELINLVSELVTTQAGLSLLAEKMNDKELQVIAEDVEKLTRRLRDNTFGIRLIPIDNMITRFQRLVRELSHDLKKNIAFYSEGTEIELDKTMIEGLIDPIMHIIRNSIDHGIESPETRKKLGKPEQGKINFRAFHSGSSVLIELSDDGSGMELSKIRKHAISKGLVQPDAVLSNKEILDFIFLPGFSTTDKITNISGRGVGMDVVKRNISDLRGEVNIDTKVNEGTRVTIKLPLTLSIIDGLLVRIENEYYVIPLASVNKCFEFRHDTLVNAVNNMIFVNDGHIPFIYLRKEFGINSKSPDLEQVVVIEYGDTRIGITVDKVIGEYQAVLKSLGNLFKKQDIVSGATILGDGTVALVLDPNRIISQFSYQSLADGI
jgi:two-component system chemotaxis sensor kinase CheA